MKNLILSTLSDARLPDFSSRPEVDVFLHSARTVPDADLVLLSDKLNRRIPHVVCPSSPNIVLDRWLFFYQFLCATSYDQVLIVDSRDVYFQSNPFAFSNGRVILSGEGVLHKDSGWNATDQERSLASFGLSYDISAWPVVNGGVLMGPRALVRDYCLLIYTNSRGSVTETDQAIIGRLWNTALKYNNDYTLADPHTDSFCATGETLKQGKLATPVIFEEGFLKNLHGTPYALFHQWERTEYRDAILASYTTRTHQ